jgi:putative membrane-bound dehydrogenase-like protein
MRFDNTALRFTQQISLAILIVVLCGKMRSFALQTTQAPPNAQQLATLEARLSADGSEVQVFRQGQSLPLVTQVAKPDFRPFLHPVMAPTGDGVMTQFSPGHHRHQTGIYWGFTRLNGRDYFHHPEGEYFRRESLTVLKPSAASSNDNVQWQTVYDLLDEQGQPLMRETQLWSAKDEGDQLILDLQWVGHAKQNLTIEKYDYGGLFIRMPWEQNLGGAVVNSARQRDARAEGERSVWLDVGVNTDTSKNRLHFAVFDHPSNPGYPQPWRVDGQLGVGPVRARLGGWQIEQGRQEAVRHRLIAYTGERTDAEISNWWSQFSGQGDYAMWGLAQQEGRQAQFLNPQEALAKMTMQEGVVGNVYAAEPMMAQPMAFCWDAKGRIWVAENRDYETRQSGFSNDGTSRILILEDTDRDGVADSRKVFLEGIPFPSAIAVGMDGLWLGAPPNLLFVPDRNQDDVAEMEDIEVRLTGWGISDRHETLNSFHWGPDGWLYGLQGFATPSQVGKPKGQGKVFQPKESFPTKIEFDGQPIDINGGVWRYHPYKDRFEVVAHGFSNPWGIDYDKYGQLFITACVIPHLWHVIPGGIYHRQGGSHFNPYVYDDIKTIAEHRHRSAHGGARVYQSDAFDQKYHGRIFMANIHEHAVLTDVLDVSGSGYVGTHGDDFALANNAQWIGFGIEVGPEGAVYALDWHDADICGKEVLNKDTGRIFRFTPKESHAHNFANRYADLNGLSDLALSELQSSPSVWHATQARTILQHRAHQGQLSPECISLLRSCLYKEQDVERRLRGLWALHVTNLLAQDELEALLGDQDQYLRAWAVQLICEDKRPSPSALQKMLKLAGTEKSPIVRLYLAAAAQRVSATERWLFVEKLSLHGEDNQDHNIPKMLWFATEGLVMQDADRALKLASNSRLQLLSRHIARRLCDGQRLEWLSQQLKQHPTSEESLVQLLLGIRDACDGRFDIQAPAGWSETSKALALRGPAIAELVQRLSQQFGDSQTAVEMLSTLRDSKADLNTRRTALQQLSGRKRAELKADLISLLDEDELRREAIRAVAAYDDVRLAKAILARYSSLSPEEKIESIYTLSARGSYAQELTNAIRVEVVPRTDIPAHVARLIRRVVGNRFVDVWGPVDELAADKESLFTKYRELLTAERLASADRNHGKELFQRTCANCHQLHGVGGKIGPDITGANRGNLEYLLSNILTPSAIIQDAYRMHIILTHDGRIYSGIPFDENDQTLKLHVADSPEPVVISLSSIESREVAAVSMMPEGLLSSLTDSQIVDLFGYLQN